jgi:hypothetical protein
VRACDGFFFDGAWHSQNAVHVCKIKHPGAICTPPISTGHR